MTEKDAELFALLTLFSRCTIHEFSAFQYTCNDRNALLIKRIYKLFRNFPSRISKGTLRKRVHICSPFAMAGDDQNPSASWSARRAHIEQIVPSPRASKRLRTDHVLAEQDAPLTQQLRQFYAQFWENPQSSFQDVPDVVSQIYDSYITNRSCENEVIQFLDDTFYLPRFLWPIISHVLPQSHAGNNVALALSFIRIFNHRRCTQRDRATPYLQLFAEAPAAFSALIAFLFQTPPLSLLSHEKSSVMHFTSHLFYALDIPAVSNVLLPLVSLPVWVNLRPEIRAAQLDAYPCFEKSMSKILRHVRKRDADTVSPLPERFLFGIVQSLESLLLSALERPECDDIDAIAAHSNLLATVISIPSFHQVILPLLEDRSTLPFLHATLSDVDPNGPTPLRAAKHHAQRFVDALRQAAYPPAGLYQPESNATPSQSRLMSDLQITMHAMSENTSRSDCSPLRTLSLYTHDQFGTPGSLDTCLASCVDESIDVMCEVIGLRNPCEILIHQDKCASIVPPTKFRELKLRAFTFTFARQKSAINTILESPTLVSNVDLKYTTQISPCLLPLPTLDREFPSLLQCILCNFTLCKWEAAARARGNIEAAVRFQGQDGPGIPVRGVRVVDVSPPMPGVLSPQAVVVLVELDGKPARHVLTESVLEGETVFIVKVLKGTGSDRMSKDHFDDCIVRSLVVRKNGEGQTFSHRRILGFLDCNQYRADKKQNSEVGDFFKGFQMLVPSPRAVSELHATLISLRAMALSHKRPVARWIEKMLLGVIPTDEMIDELGDGQTDRNEEIDLHDTFLSQEHLCKSFPSRIVVFSDNGDAQNNDDGRSCHRLKEVGHEEGDVIEVTRYVVPQSLKWPSVLTNGNRREWNQTDYSGEEVEMILSGMRRKVTLVNCHSTDIGYSGSRACITQTVMNLCHADATEKILIVARTEHTLHKLCCKMRTQVLDATEIILVTDGGGMSMEKSEFSIKNVVQVLLQKRVILLSVVERLGVVLEGFSRESGFWTCAAAGRFWESNVLPAWRAYEQKENPTWEESPFRQFFEETFDESGFTKDGKVEFKRLRSLFGEIESLQFLEVLRDDQTRASFVLCNHARIIAMTVSYAAIHRERLISLGFSFTSVILLEAGAMLEAEALITLGLQPNHAERLRRVMFVGDQAKETPSVLDIGTRNVGNLQQSLFTRLVRIGYPVVRLSKA